MKKLLGITAVLLILVGGCVNDPATELSDSDHIQNLLAGSSVIQMTPLDNQGGDEGKGLGGKCYGLPECWWREIITEGSFEVIQENDPTMGICTVTVIRELHAEFNIDVVHDGVRDPGVKPIIDIRTRRAIVEHREEVNTNGGWVLTHITPAEYALNSGLTQEVFIQSMQVYSGDDLIWECDSPDTFFDVEEGLPVLEPGELVRLEVEILHTNPQYSPEFYVFVHGPCPTWPRHFMNDEGLFGDRTAGDDIYSYEWYVEPTSRWWCIAADVIDADTMLDQIEDDYDSGAWGILALKE